MLRSKTCLRGLAALVAFSLLTATAVEAQQKKQQPGGQRSQRQRGGSGGASFGGRGGGAPSALQLIGREEVRKELKISEEQQGIIRELQQSSRPDFRALFGGNFRDLSREEREKKMAELRTTSEKKSKEAEADLYGLILDEGQTKRLKQIVLQQKGNRALTEADIAKALGLTAAQSAKIKAAMETGQKKQQELTAGLRGAFGGRSSGGEKGAKKTERKRPSREDIQKRFADMQSKGTAIRAETDKAIASVLTTGQKTKFETLKGPKFELARRSSSRNRGGSRGGSRGGQGEKGQGGRPQRPQRSGAKKKGVA
jgi:Spy/CpxP family protein refolding chaperone